MKKKKILYIEDEPEARNLVGDILRNQPYELITADNGNDGLKLAKKILPDLILLDIMLPHMDGLKVQVLLKADKKTKGIPVVFITAKSDLENTIKAVSQGAAGYIEKPFEVKRLLAKIQSLLED